jgi:pimeloyl-ACP methyl ester carboxylesterase
MILLHGTNSWAREMLPLAESMRPYESKFLMPNLPGHGGRDLPERFTVADFAKDVIAYMDSQGVERDFILGMSTGGYVALYLARHHPERVEGVVTIATKWIYDEETVKHVTWLVSVERLGQPGHPRVAQFDLNHHPNDWREISRRNAELFRAQGRSPEVSEEDIRRITVPVLAISGDDDPIVKSKETQALRDINPRVDVLIVKGASHPITQLPLDLVAQQIAAWIARARRQAAKA